MIKHLPPSIKQLLTLRTPHSWSGPPVSNLQGLFSRTQRDARLRNAETAWLVLTTCTLLAANRPASVGHLYRFTTRPSMEDNTSIREDLARATNKASIMRESALKSTIFVGVPRVILSLAALYEVLEDDVKQTLRKQSRRSATSGAIEPTIQRGQTLWNSIYAPHADKLQEKLGAYHPDFISFIIQAYGTVLAPLPGGTKSYNDETSIDDPDQGNLSQALGSVVGMATLRAEGRVGPQLTSHTFGLLKARMLEGKSQEDIWVSSDEGTEWVLRTVDEILGVLDASEAADIAARVKL